MYIITKLAIVINIISIIILLIGLFCNFEQPKNKAIYGYYIAGSLLMYIFVLSSVVFYGVVVNPKFCDFILGLCIISPFIVGKLVRYETLKKYTFIQIICFVVSLVTLLLKL